MPFWDGLKIIEEGRKKVSEERLWEQYLTIYPHMTEENFVSFNEFKSDAFKPASSKKTKNEIMNEVKNIIELTLAR